MADLDTALHNHDRVKRSTDIPLFYGNKQKDNVSAQQLVDRIDRAAIIAKWDQSIGAVGNYDEIAIATAAGEVAGAKRRCDELYLCLRDKAMSWYHTLDDTPDVDPNLWTDLRKEFLEAYAPRYTARTLCVSLQELRQRGEENVQDYYNRVSDAFRTAYQIKQDNLRNFTGTADERGGATEEEAHTINLAGVQKMQRHMMNTIFLGGLREELRSKVLEDENEIEDIRASVKRARALEILVHEKATKGSVITSVKENEEPSEEDSFQEKIRAAMAIMRTQEEEEQIVAAFRAQTKPQKGAFRQGGPPRTTRSGSDWKTSKTMVCWYCNITGHTQVQCRKRQAEGGKFVSHKQGTAIHTIEDHPESYTRNDTPEIPAYGPMDFMKACLN